VNQRFLCIHGHFYQPPRDNPWIEHLEQQESAAPYHDWNERITTECYAPNGAARILDDKGFISQIRNNYAELSFNVGPTLLAWMEKQAPDTYASILAADRESVQRFGGHGSAMAQAYNHLIMPLANRRDKVTQVRWGLKDFERRFGRQPEGMWLPETAVDIETLEVVAEHGITFTVLAPHQAARVRAPGATSWTEVPNASIDTTLPYRATLPSGKSIALFFYNGPLSRAVAFEGMLSNGEVFARRLLSGFKSDIGQPQLAHIATDGETYGHHHRFGEMALAYALKQIEADKAARITNYGEFLALHPAVWEVQIAENTSWSCAHGVERWRSDCGCNIGMDAKWNQAWRKPLREALDCLRDRLAELFERKGREIFLDPWAARDAYIDVVLNRTPAQKERFFAAHLHPTQIQQRISAWKLLEMQRHALLMFTSCGWFFDELSRIEGKQILSYAARAIQLAEELSGESLEEPFLKSLALAKSNVIEVGDGRMLWDAAIKPKVVKLEQVAAHYSVRSLFKRYEEHDNVYCYQVHRDAFELFEGGRSRLAVGKVRITSDITEESARLCFGVLHFGDHTLNGGVKRFVGDSDYDAMVSSVGQAFERADLAEVVRELDRHFDKLTYSLASLFHDQRRAILDLILASTVREAEASYRELKHRHAPLMRFLRRMNLPVPRAIKLAGEFVLNNTLKDALAAPSLDLEQVLRLLDEAKAEALEVDRDSLTFSVTGAVARATKGLSQRPHDLSSLQALLDAVMLVRTSGLDVNLWPAQTALWAVTERHYPGLAQKGRAGDARASLWADRFAELANALRMRLPT